MDPIGLRCYGATLHRARGRCPAASGRGDSGIPRLATLQGGVAQLFGRQSDAMTIHQLTPSTGTDAPRRSLPVLLILFFGSGCAALIYEVVWLQLLQLVIDALCF